MVKRYRIALVPVDDALPVKYRRRPSEGSQKRLHSSSLQPDIAVVLRALRRLTVRGPGESAWAAPFSALSFILDSIEASVVIRHGSGEIMYANTQYSEIEALPPSRQQIERITVGSSVLERRTMTVNDEEHGLLQVEVTRRL